jgi:hypothetical protein
VCCTCRRVIRAWQRGELVAVAPVAGLTEHHPFLMLLMDGMKL